MTMRPEFPLRSKLSANLMPDHKDWRREYEQEPAPDTPEEHLKVLFDGIPADPMQIVVKDVPHADAVDITATIRVSNELLAARIRNDIPREEMDLEGFLTLLNLLGKLITYTVAYDDGETTVIDIRLPGGSLGTPALYRTIAELEHTQKTIVITDRKQVDFNVKFLEGMFCVAGG